MINQYFDSKIPSIARGICSAYFDAPDRVLTRTTQYIRAPGKLFQAGQPLWAAYIIDAINIAQAHTNLAWDYLSQGEQSIDKPNIDSTPIK